MPANRTDADVRIGGNLSPLESALKRAQAKLQSFGRAIFQYGMATVATNLAIVGPLIGATMYAAELGSQMLDTSQRTGMSVEALSELKYAAEMSGAEMGDLVKAMKGVSILTAEAANGSKDAADKLDQLGLKVDDLNGLSQDQRFDLIIDRLAAIRDPAQRAAAAVAVFGRAGMAMMPLLADGADGLRKLRDEARRLGLVMSDEDAKAAEALGDQIGTLKSQFKMVTFQIGMALLPMAKDFVTWAIETTAEVIQWVKVNKELIATFFRGRLAEVAFGAGIALLGIVVMGVATTIGFLAALLPFLKIGLIAVGIVLAALVGTAIMVGAVFGVLWLILKSTGASIAGIWEGIKAGAAYLAGYFQPAIDVFLRFWTVVRQVASGIYDALSAGELKLAWEIAVRGMELIWLRVVNSMKMMWLDFKYLFIANFGAMAQRAQDILFALAKGFGAALASMIQMMIDMVNRVVDSLPEFVRSQTGITRIEANPHEVMKDAYARLRQAVPRFQTERDAAAERAAARDQMSEEEKTAQEKLDAQVRMAAYLAKQRRQATRQAPQGTELDLAGAGSAFGSYSAAAVSNFGVTSPMTRLINATERQNDLLERIDESINNIPQIRAAA